MQPVLESHPVVLFSLFRNIFFCKKNFSEAKCQCVLTQIVAHQLGIGIRIASPAETNVEVYNVILAKRSSCNNTAQYTSISTSTSTCTSTSTVYY